MTEPPKRYRSPFDYKVPASQTEEGKERIRAYYEALGCFVDIFAKIETGITLTLWKYARTSPTIAKVVFAGTKIELGSSFIKQLAKEASTTQEQRDDLDFVLQQLGIINGVRNNILHYGATSVAEGNAIVSNALKAKGEANVFPISPTLLDQMTEDLRKITWHIAYRHLGRPMPLGQLGRAFLQGVFLTPWQYKHPTEPKSQRAKARKAQTRKRGPKPPRQP